MTDMKKTDPAIRVVMMPRDTNAQGTIFGGVILSYIDQAAFVEAVRYCAAHKYVTVAMDGIEFKHPVFVGDILSCYTEVTRVGRTSLTIRVEVVAERSSDRHACVEVTVADVVFVAVDDERRPMVIDGSSSDC
jgi:acyl-CoA thioesterase YciA